MDNHLESLSVNSYAIELTQLDGIYTPLLQPVFQPCSDLC